MQFNCTNCGHLVEQHRSPAKNDPNAGDAWVCMKCPEIICCWCYIAHQTKHHPELYEPKKKPTGAHKKNKKHKK